MWDRNFLGIPGYGKKLANQRLWDIKDRHLAMVLGIRVSGNAR